ncbi:MAG: ROK family protein [Deltaproteobacteria bacterium]|nr:ROK family protein [Deltaproteobacteria bacterium]
MVKNKKNEIQTKSKELLGNAYLRAVNRSTVLELFKGGTRLSRSDVSRYCALTKPTVSAIVDSLLTDGVLREVGPGKSDGGRRATLIEMNPGFATFAGIHFGEEQTRVAICDALGNTLAKKSVSTVTGDARASIRAANRLAIEALKSSGHNAKEINAVGVSVPGLIERQEGHCLIAPNLSWRNVPLGRLISEIFDAPVSIANTTQAGAVAEAQLGVAKGIDNFIWVYVGKGVGSCTVSNGKILYGRRGYTGEIGHCKVEHPGIVCGCGKRGCLETVCSDLAIVREYGDDSLTSEDICKAAENGDELSRTIIRNAGSALGLGISHLINLYDPSMVVISGDEAGSSKLFVESARQRALEDSLEPEGVGIVSSCLGKDVYLKGALLMAMDLNNSTYRIVRGNNSFEPASSIDSVESNGSTDFARR